jgi:hypothetical protein
MAIDINIPSQVKNYANLAGFPATGSLKTIYIAEDTNKTYRWTGSAYVEISASQAAAWGTITGTLSAQTDLQTALNGKVPTTRTLTINGTTQDLSADRTFTISTGITIGTTAINSGTVGRILFEGTGNVVQESANLFWDNATSFFGVGTSSPLTTFDLRGNQSITFADVANPDIGPSAFKISNGTFSKFAVVNDANRCRVNILGTSTQGLRIESGANTNVTVIGGGGLTLNATSNNFSIGANTFLLNTGGSERIRIPNTGNVLINTTTDAGFKLDVNGTARFSGNTSVVGTSLSSFAVSNGATAMIQTASSGIAGSDFRFRLFTNNQAQTLDLMVREIMTTKQNTHLE